MAITETPPAGDHTPDQQKLVRIAHSIAMTLWDEGYRGSGGITVLAVAMGIYMEAQEGSHRGLLPIAEAVCDVAQQTFDAFQQGKARRAGNA